MKFKKGQGGRQKGTKNKRTVAKEHAAKEGPNKDLTPLAHLLKIMRNPRQSKEDRNWAAAQAAPYMHPRLKSTEIRNADGETLTIRVVR